MDRESKLIFEAYTLKGLAAGKTLADIAKKHDVSVEEMQAALEKGMKVEHEHTGNEAAAKKIAMDHLFEDPKYYIKLAKAEGEEGKDEEGDLMLHMKQKGMIPGGAKVTMPAHASQEDEELKGGQKKLDANHDGKISGTDFKILKKRKGEDQ